MPPEYLYIDGRVGRLITEMQSGSAFYTVYETQGTSSAVASGRRATTDNGAAEARTAPSSEAHEPLPQLDLVFAKQNPDDGTFEWIPPGLLHNALFDALEYATQTRRVCNACPSSRTFDDSRKREIPDGLVCVQAACALGCADGE